MIFFLDENIPKMAEVVLRNQGHQTIDIRGTNKEGLDDHSLFELALENRAVFLTTDKDFFHTIPFSYLKHYGLIVINLSQPNRKNIIEKLTWFLENITLNNIENKIFLLRDNTISVIDSSKDKK